MTSVVVEEVQLNHDMFHPAVSIDSFLKPHNTIEIADRARCSLSFHYFFEAVPNNLKSALMSTLVNSCCLIKKSMFDQGEIL